MKTIFISRLGLIIFISFLLISCASHNKRIELVNKGKYAVFVETESGKKKVNPAKKITWDVKDGSIKEKMRVIIQCPYYPYYCIHWWTIEEECIESIEFDISLDCEEGDKKCTSEGNCYVLFN